MAFCVVITRRNIGRAKVSIEPNVNSGFTQSGAVIETLIFGLTNSFSSKPIINPTASAGTTGALHLYLFPIKNIKIMPKPSNASLFREEKTSTPNLNKTPPSIAITTGLGTNAINLPNKPVTPTMIKAIEAIT